MEHSPLIQLISSLEFGTNLHISIVFLNCYGNRKTLLSSPHCIHTCPVCDHAKSTPEGFAACFRCRNTVLKWCIRHKTSLDGFCVKGVYEYCRPVIRNTQVVAVIFVGNILTDSTTQNQLLRKSFKETLLCTMQTGFTKEDCVCTADILESYIHFLLDEYGQTLDSSTDALIENIKNYIAENLGSDFSMADLSEAFPYNSKYLGRLFKAKTGYTVKEYCNLARIKAAKFLLADTNLRICEIAAKAGFNNVAYFNRTFKAYTGTSPTEYRLKRTASTN